MKSWSLISLLSLTLTLSTPNVVLSHVGHGDEFQATGGIERVQINPETDSLLGIVVTSIAAASDGSSAVMIPMTALVRADGKQLVFVKYGNFYEPVEVATGVTEGEFIEITEGLSIGEQLVIQGSLSLYAESRKTKTAEPETTAPTHAQADAQGIPHSHDSTGNMIQKSGQTTENQSGGLSWKAIATIVGGSLVLVSGTFVAMGNGSKKKEIFSNKN
ncbi:efflux RND transporter periplasmic adaptor subunit [Roseofilum reptotaenium CS-1145]|uniref:Cobalt transporter n=1 Tax=Roseofilum reptotaenium AO1-A TaxID=1925591 RepID=A0A1L9QRU9_9CYAN|nr:efflux RND transporter periplasmic adaptor subunit [Roseofilum reptotaenium]MDB9515625.1 efflux RND transporter periplasmic adaptor subunit [Roseofilum reptotaenium CS-1145]OJJ25362.1 cobalt transporter [Roseofilum reptotaenium AO1-A]